MMEGPVQGAALVLLLLLAAVLLPGAAAQTAARWRSGRATFYGAWGPPAGVPPSAVTPNQQQQPTFVSRMRYAGTDAWSIHKGSCGYGWLDRRIATGYDVAAISDVAQDFQGSCGKCKEVRCKPMQFADGYGQWLDRKDVCYSRSASVVVMITDTCPCHYPDNYVSNKRWCCGDMYHLDLSLWAYEKLADKKWGVIGIQWRDVPCWYKPRRPARVPKWQGKPTPMPWWERKPSGWDKSMDRRINNQYQFQNGGKH